MVRLYWCESESDIAFGWVHGEFNIMFTLISDKDPKEKTSFSLSVNSVLDTNFKFYIHEIMWCISP